MKTLYLHVGTPKTGTTAIQQFCAQNGELLAQKGICFRLTPYHYAGTTHERNACFILGKLYDETGAVDKERTSERIAEGTALVKSWFEEFETVILSDEGIWHGGVRKKKKEKRKKDLCMNLCEKCKITVLR